MAHRRQHSAAARLAALGAVTALAATFAQLAGAPPAVAAASPVANYVMSPTPIASPGSLGEGESTGVTLQAVDSSGNGITGATVYLSFSSSASNAGSACVNTSSGCTKLTGTPTSYPTGNQGLLSLTYTTFGQCLPGTSLPGTTQCQPGSPSSGSDTITAQNAGTNPTVSDTDSYTYTGALSFVFKPSPIAPATKLNGSTSAVQVTLTVLQNGSPATAKTVFLSFSRATKNSFADNASASAVCASGAPPVGLGGAPQPCQTDSSNGTIALSYTPASGSSLPSSGADIITAQDQPTSPSSSATDEYDYAATQFSFSPTPIAANGALGSSQSSVVALTVTDSGGKAEPNTSVWLSLAGTGGGAATASQPQNPLSSAVGTSPTQFSTDSNGKVLITYTTPAKPPSSGTDTLTAQDASSNPSATQTDTYTYAPPAFTFSPNPIAATGSLSGSQSVPVTVAVQSNGQPSPGGTVFLSFSQATGGGSASVGATQLTATPQPFTADASGNVSISYTTPASPPPSGTDTITAANAQSSPTKTAADTYTFGQASSQIPQGYWLVGQDGGIFSFGVAKFHGSTGNIHLAAPIVGMAATPDAGGYWFVGADGGVFSFGDARYWGSTGNIHLAQPVVGMASTPDGGGYWLVAKDGGIFTFGDARFFGSTGNIHLAAPIVGMAATPDGGGYWFVGSDGGVFSFGDARFHGSTGNIHLAKPVVGMASTTTGNGYWLVASDGGIFTFGDASFFGSTGAITLAQPVVGMSPTPDGGGYWFVASDGGVFSFGDAHFFGSMGATRLAAPIVGMAGI